ncbi:MAG: DUF885 domain-containing protein [Proteobacteria bacterium]|nr:DUF885 domain-containing protein [Pseudomonadota bacterium]
MRIFSVLCACFLAGCAGAGSPATTGPDTTTRPDKAAEHNFQRAAEAFYWDHLNAFPPLGVQLGYHQYDGKLPDVSPAAIAASIDMYKKARDTFATVAADQLSAQSRVEREVLLVEIRRQLFDLEVLKFLNRNPIAYTFGFSLMPYVSFEYAPAARRARAIIELCGGAGQYFAQAQKNLPEVMPRTWIAIALLQTGGMIEFVKNDVATAMTGLDGQLAAKLKGGLQQCVAALGGFRDFLKARMAMANDDFALGKERFIRMLREKEAIDITLERLAAVGEADLQRNLAAVKIAARRVDPSRNPNSVVWAVAGEKPPGDKVIATATEQSARLRQFLIDRDIVTIPSDDLAEVRPSPPFMRFNSAFLRAAGLFEKQSLPSFYFISPPDPSWPEEQQRGYIPSYGNLLSTSVHELWPGHFLQHLHKKKNPSKILKTFCTYTNTEGWAHYTEEMMWEAGSSKNDAKMHLGQLGDALLRNVRFKAAIAFHTGDATVDQVAAWFEKLAFKDKGNAVQQAVRGTFDPGYLNYTLGKLMIMKLRRDWQAKVGADYSLRAFHDTFLSYGCAPIPIIRREMLGDDSPPL